MEENIKNKQVLSKEEQESVSGGGFSYDPFLKCPNCKQYKIDPFTWKCRSCGYNYGNKNPK